MLEELPLGAENLSGLKPNTEDVNAVAEQRKFKIQSSKFKTNSNFKFSKFKTVWNIGILLFDIVLDLEL